MAILNILEFPDPRLRKKAKPVELVDKTIQQLADDMLETMYAAPGVGLAATQVNVHLRLLVLDISDDKNQPMVFINPEIIPIEGEQFYEEGCLSVPGFQENIKRLNLIRVKALNQAGEAFDIECDGLLSVCIQHEVDHLNGKLFVDYLSGLKREIIAKKLKKQQKNSSTKNF